MNALKSTMLSLFDTFRRDILLIIMIVIFVKCGFSVHHCFAEQTLWREVGPGGGGAVRDFAFDPYDHDRVYLTSDLVGVFVSNDAGNQWRWSSYGAAKQIGGIAVDPTNPRILYAVGPEGIYRSTDKSNHWQLIYSKGNGYQGINNHNLGSLKNSVFGKPGQSVSISPAGIVYVCTVNGNIIISHDKGISFQQISLAEKSSVKAVIPTQEKEVVAALDKYGIYLSRDEGSTWEKTLSPAGDSLLALSIYPEKRHVLYALMSNRPLISEMTTRIVQADLHKSMNGGRSWKLIHSFDKFSLNKDRRIMDINQNGTIIILTGHGPIRSTDGGLTWMHSNIVGSENDGFIYHALKGRPVALQSVFADPWMAGRWFMTSGLAAFRSDDDGKTWQYKVKGLRQQGYWFIKVNPANPDIIIASDMDHGLIRSSDGGNTWSDIGITSPFEECNNLRFSPNDDSYKTAFAFFYHPYPFIAKSTDAGATWSVVASWKNKKRRSMNGFCVAKGKSTPILFVGEPNAGIWRYDEEDAVWTKKINGLPKAAEMNYIQFLETDVRGYIYAGIGSNAREKGGIFKSTDRGETWFPINRGLKLFVRRNSFEIDPNNPDVLWVGAGRTVYRSKNGGTSWEKRIEGIYGSAILVEPGNSNNVYIASFAGGGIVEQFTAGIYKSVDGGNYFFRISGDLYRTIGSSYRLYDLEYGWGGKGRIWGAPVSGGLIYISSQMGEE